MFPGHYKELANHTRALADELLNQLRARHANEGTISVMSYSSGKKSFPGTRWAIKKDAYRSTKNDLLSPMCRLDCNEHKTK